MSEEDILNEFKELLQSKNIEIIEFSELKIFRKELLGKGGVGRVYKGKYVSSDVAIKVYFQYNLYDNFQDENTVEIITEIVNALSLKLPKVNQCYGVSINENDGTIYTVHELAGGSLTSKLKENLTVSEKNDLTKQILEIMTHLYKKKIVHRDLKPDNFLISKHGELQVSDFGTIRKLKHEVTKTGNLSFTVRYAPPEFILEENKAGLFSDVWSIGLILYLIYYGNDLWMGKSEKEIEKCVREQNIPTVEYRPNIPKQITEVIRESLVFEGEKRISMMDIQKRLEKLLN